MHEFFSVFTHTFQHKEATKTKTKMESVRVTRGDAADAERLYRLYRRLGTE